jgi:uncharacterized protein YkwD/LysM repeat protein
MHYRFLRPLLIVVIALSFLLPSTTHTQAAAANGLAFAGTPTDLINAVNALRASYSLPPYTVNSTLMAAAQGHADYMAAAGNVSHTGAGGSTVSQRLLSLGYPLAGDLSLGGFRSENITSGSEGMSAQEVVNRWTGDAPHLTTMISPDLTEIGAGVTVHNGRVYYVIDCARPTDGGVPQVVDPSLPGTSPVAGPSLPAGVSGIMIPVVVVTPNPAGDVIHEVKAGQTLWQIAISYETKIDEIKRLNNLFDNEIYPGTKLLVKKGVFLSPTVPAETPILETVAAAKVLPATQAAQIPTRAAVPADMPVTTSTRNTLQIAIGIIVLAVLGGGVVAWWGSRKK